MTKHSSPTARSRRLGRKGFTLVELSIVLVLVAILGTMTVSFTTLVSGYSGSNQKEYEFLEQCTRFQQTLTDWVSEYDSSDYNFTVFSATVLQPSKLQFSSTSTDKPTASFSESDNCLSLGDTKSTFSMIGSVEFAHKEQMIRCTLTCARDESLQKSFIFSLRCAKKS